MITFMGTDGTLYIDRGRYELTPEPGKGKREELILGSNPRKGHDFYDKPDGELLHLTNWVECIRSRQKPNAPAEAGVSRRGRPPGQPRLPRRPGGRLDAVLRPGLPAWALTGGAVEFPDALQPMRASGQHSPRDLAPENAIERVRALLDQGLGIVKKGMEVLERHVSLVAGLLECVHHGRPVGRAVEQACETTRACGRFPSWRTP